VHWEWRDGESSVYTSGVIHQESGTGRWSIILSGGAGPVHALEDLVQGYVCRFETGTCICHVVRKP
jgi:hypothetical protein